MPTEIATEFWINRKMDDMTGCATVRSTKEEDIVDPDKKVTDLTDIKLDVTCNPYSCGKVPILSAHSDSGFTVLELFKLIRDARMRRGLCDHNFIETIQSDGQGNFNVSFGS